MVQMRQVSVKDVLGKKKKSIRAFCTCEGNIRILAHHAFVSTCECIYDSARVWVEVREMVASWLSSRCVCRYL